MASKTLKTRIMLKHDYLSAWQNSSLHLSAGEIAVSFTLGEGDVDVFDGIKVGIKDGKTWSQLPYSVKGDALSTDAQISAAIAGIVGDVSAVSAVLSTKQDTLVFNTAYNASTNKVATMADISQSISGAMHFRGVVTQVINASGSDPATTVPAPSTPYTDGDVVLNTSNSKEYVLYSGVWYQLGDETAVANLETNVSTISTNLSNLSSDIYTASTGLSAKVGTVSTNLGTVSTNLGTVSTDLGTVSTNLTVISSNLGTLSSDIYTANTGLSAKVIKLSTDLGNINIDTDHLNQGVSCEWCLNGGNSHLSSTDPTSNQ